MKRRALLGFLIAFFAAIPALRAASIGEKAPAFELNGIDGKKSVINGVAGDVTFVNFWASWCGPCVIEFPTLNKLAGEYEDKGVKVVAVSVDTEKAAAEGFLRRFAKDPLHLKVLLDPESKALDAYGAKAMPTSYILDRKGMVRFIHVGFRPDDPEKWRKEIDELLNEKKK